MGTASLGTTSEFQLEREQAGKKTSQLCLFILIMEAKPIPEVLFSKLKSHWPEKGHMATLSHMGSGKWIILSFPTAVMEAKDYSWALGKPSYNVCHTDKHYDWKRERHYYSRVMSLSLQLGKDTIYFNRSKFQGMTRLTEMMVINDTTS